MEIMWQYSAVSFEMLQIGSCLRLNLKKVSDDNAKPLQTSFILQLLKNCMEKGLFKLIYGQVHSTHCIKANAAENWQV